MSVNLKSLRKELAKLKNPEKAKILQSFFKTGKGQYGEGDKFLGITVPQSRSVARKYAHISFKEITTLLESKIHEERLVAILLLVILYQKSSDKKIIDFYLAHTKYINNWDLVDLSAPKLLGEFLVDKDKSILYKLAKSKNLWERRIAIVSTHAFIKRNQFADTLNLAEILLTDKHDLMHKAVGWMLREVGKRSVETEETFLKQNYKQMPRTMLRYAIERFPEDKRQDYLRGEI